MGTPTIGHDVLGLGDSITHGETEINIIEKSPRAVVQQAISLLRSRGSSIIAKMLLNMQRQFSWDKTVDSSQKSLDNQTETNADVILD